MNKVAWDKGIDYETAYALLVRKLKGASKKTSKCYAGIFLIQLRNGSRISEAVRCFKQYLINGGLEQRVRVSKKKTVEERLMVIPLELEECEIKRLCVDLLSVDDRKLINRLKTYASRNLKINTHSLRYSFITYLLKRGVNPAVVSKIIKHSRLDQLLTYVQTKYGEELLKKLDYIAG